MGETIWMPYCGAAPEPGELFARWNLDPVLLLGFVAAIVAYLRFGGTEPARRAWFAAAVGILAVLFVSPFCALTSALFAARVAHHVLLTAVAAPLLAAALPGARGGVAIWAGLHAVAFWLWHAPPVYGWALSNHSAYWLMQASLLGSAVMLWGAVRAAPMPAAIAALLGTMVQMGLLGALITFAPAPLYAPHVIGPIAWGFTPLEDQQLAGLIMWAPGAAVYLAAALALLSRWFVREQAAA